MPLTFEKFLSTLASSKPAKAAALQEVTPEELDDLSDAIHGCLTFRRFQDPTGGGLRINPVSRLNAKSQSFLNRNIQAFQRRLSLGEIRITKQAGGAWTIAGAEGDRTEAIGTTSNPCTWFWKLKYYFWGIRLGLNHCAVQWLAGGAASAGAAISAFGLPGWIGAIMLVAAAVLKLFDRGCGVRLYITWVGIWWVGPRPLGVDHC